MHLGTYLRQDGWPTHVCAQREAGPYSGSMKTLFVLTVPGTISGRMISAAKMSLRDNSAKLTEQALMSQTQASGLPTTPAAKSSVSSVGPTRSPLMLRWDSTGSSK